MPKRLPLPSPDSPTRAGEHKAPENLATESEHHDAYNDAIRVPETSSRFPPAHVAHSHCSETTEDPLFMWWLGLFLRFSYVRKHKWLDRRNNNE